jgi:hypothetical protein
VRLLNVLVLETANLLPSLHNCIGIDISWEVMLSSLVAVTMQLRKKLCLRGLVRDYSNRFVAFDLGLTSTSLGVKVVYRLVGV